MLDGSTPSGEHGCREGTHVCAGPSLPVSRAPQNSTEARLIPAKTCPPPLWQANVPIGSVSPRIRHRVVTSPS